MTDPKFCFRSNVQYPNQLLLRFFYDAPELLHIIIIIIISFSCPLREEGLGTGHSRWRLSSMRYYC
jgi:hypothetical protein